MKRQAASLGPADWLGLAAAPTFALMAVLTTYFGGSHSTALCTQAEQLSVLTGMAPMYLLMAAFHIVPWFKLIKLRT